MSESEIAKFRTVPVNAAAQQAMVGIVDALNPKGPSLFRVVLPKGAGLVKAAGTSGFRGFSRSGGKTTHAVLKPVDAGTAVTAGWPVLTSPPRKPNCATFTNYCSRHENPVSVEGRELHATRDFPADAVVVVILPDSGRGYMSKVFDDTWMASYGFLHQNGGRTAGEVLKARPGACRLWCTRTRGRRCATPSSPA